MAQRSKLYQALAAQTILVCLWDHFIVGFGLFIGFVDNKKKKYQTFNLFMTIWQILSSLLNNMSF